MRIHDFEVGLDQPLFLIAGPCVIESPEFAWEVADALRDIARRQSVHLVFKASYDKANRTSGDSFRGPGLEEGLEVLAEVRRRSALPVLTDVHAVADVERVAGVVDVVQIPAFLCRQTDLVQAAAASGRPLHIKKGQFLSPAEMRHVVAKAEAAGGRERVMVCERGASFGYNNLVVDMRGLAIMRETGCPVVFDATHSVQLPGGQDRASGGQRQFVPVLARAAVAAGIAGVFLEVHPDPDRALCDGPNTWPLSMVEPLIEQLRAIDSAVKSGPWLEDRVAHS